MANCVSHCILALAHLHDFQTSAQPSQGLVNARCRKASVSSCMPAPMKSVPMEPSYKPPSQQGCCNCDIALHSHHGTASKLVENRASRHRLSTVGRANDGHHTLLLRFLSLQRYHFFDHSSCSKHQLSLKCSLDNRYSCRFSRDWLLRLPFQPFLSGTRKILCYLLLAMCSRLPSLLPA